MSNAIVGVDIFKKGAHLEGFALAEHGALIATAGFIREALNDFDTAKDKIRANDRYWLVGQQAEAERIYARDFILNTTKDDKALADYLNNECIKHFSEALDAPKSSADDEAWLHAHRGAARTMLYWASQDPSERDSTFDAAVDDFAHALEKKKDYGYAYFFLAFLLTLRPRTALSNKVKELLQAVLMRPWSSGSNFLLAAKILESMPESAREKQSSFERDLATLYFYNAAAERAATAKAPIAKKGVSSSELVETTRGRSPKTADKPPAEREKNEAGIRSAELAVEFGVRAGSKDPNDNFAAYIVAASLAFLVEHGEGLPNHGEYCELLPSAVQTAYVRCKSALSLATVAVAGLNRISENKVIKPCLDKYTKPIVRDHSALELGPEKTEALIQRFNYEDAGALKPHETSIDLETAATVNHDPVFADLNPASRLAQLRTHIQSKNPHGGSHV
jgi:hypothetical protein